MTTLEAVVALPGVDEYMAQVEDRLAAAAAAHGGPSPRWARTRSPRAASGCARCCVPLRAAAADDPPVAAGVAVELVHMATLVHDDLVDGAKVRRGKAAAWAAHGAGRRARDR